MSIPRISGQYPDVGLTYCKVPVAKRTWGSAKFKRTRQPAFVLEEVAFQVFYPCDTLEKKARFGSKWLDKPLAQWADGYATFLGRSRWLFCTSSPFPGGHALIEGTVDPFVLLLYTLLNIPAWVGAPLKTPPADKKQWPLVIFSHGLAGTSKTYSQLCGKLAAEGNVVIAMEHRDGTAPACIYPVDGKVEPHLYLKVEELDWDDKVTNPTTPMPLRTQQLEIRHIEILEALKAFKGIVRGNKEVLCNHTDYPAWDSFVNNVNTDTIIFDGHSFGGCTGMHLLTSPTPSGYSPLPIAKAILHDPWMEPFPGAAEDAETQESAKHHVSLPVLVINSEEFTLWKSHFVSQKRLFEPWIKRAGEGSTFLTLARSKHMAFSDFPVFFTKKTPMALHEDMHRLTLGFLNGTLGNFFQANENRISRGLVVDNPNDNKKKRMRAKAGDIVIHDTTVDHSQGGGGTPVLPPTL